MAAKRVHKSEGHTETKIILVNFQTKRTPSPHIHYVGLSRLTAIDGLYITNPCEDKITVCSEIKERHHKISSHRRQTSIMHLA